MSDVRMLRKRTTGHDVRQAIMALGFGEPEYDDEVGWVVDSSGWHARNDGKAPGGGYVDIAVQCLLNALDEMDGKSWETGSSLAAGAATSTSTGRWMRS